MINTFLYQNKKGTAFIVSYIVIVVLLILGIAFVTRSVVESKIAERQKRAVQAFNIAEAGLERALYDIKADFVVDFSWIDNRDMNGTLWGPDPWTVNTETFYPLHSSVTFGEGSYSVKLKSTAEPDEIWVESTGTVDDISKSVRAYIKIGNLSLWNNVLFAGAGSAGTTINGNVDIRGSVLILGEEPFVDSNGNGVYDAGEPWTEIIVDGQWGWALSPGDKAIDMSGSGNIGNNYAGISSQLKDRIPPLLTQKEMFEGEEIDIETLEATLRIKRGKAGLSGSATVGEPDVAGNPYKETMDGVYITDGYGGNKGAENVYSDNETGNSYDLGDSVRFPSLQDPYADDPNYSYQDYLKDNACVINAPAALNQLANITPNSNFGGPGYSDINGSISMSNGNLTISGIVYIDGDIDGGDLKMKKAGANKTIIYSGQGSILVTGEVEISVNLLTPEPLPGGDPSFPANILGIMTPNNITFNAAQIDVMGLFYAEGVITAQKQTDIAGTIVSNYFDMGTNVPSIYQVPAVADNLPVGMISKDSSWVIKIVVWQKL